MPDNSDNDHRDAGKPGNRGGGNRQGANRQAGNRQGGNHQGGNHQGGNHQGGNRRGPGGNGKAEPGRGPAASPPAAPPPAAPPPGGDRPVPRVDREIPAESVSGEPLILSQMPAKNAPTAAAMPGRALVYSDRDSQTVRLTAPPRGWFAGLGGPRYEWRFEVDTTLRFDRFVERLPCRTETARFIVALDVEWSVTDPVRVVKRGLADGARIVRSRLMAVARSVGHGYPIEEIAEFERALAERFGAELHEYPEGLTVHRCDVRAEPDERSQTKLERIDDARAERRLGDEQIQALRSSIRTSSDLFLLYLAQDRDRVGDLIADMREHEQIKDSRVIELFNTAVEHNIMQPADINEMVQRLLGPISGVLQPGGRTDLFGTHNTPLDPPVQAAEPQRAITGRALGQDDDEEEDVMPEAFQQRAEDGVEGWRGMPWDS